MWGLPGVRTPFRCFLLIRTPSRICAVPVPGTSIGVDLTLGYLEQLLREPRRIETLTKLTYHIFNPRSPTIDVIYDPLFSSGRPGNRPKLCQPARTVRRAFRAHITDVTAKRRNGDAANERDHDPVGRNPTSQSLRRGQIDGAPSFPPYRSRAFIRPVAHSPFRRVARVRAIHKTLPLGVQKNMGGPDKMRRG